MQPATPPDQGSELVVTHAKYSFDPPQMGSTKNSGTSYLCKRFTSRSSSAKRCAVVLMISSRSRAVSTLSFHR